MIFLFKVFRMRKGHLVSVELLKVFETNLKAVCMNSDRMTLKIENLGR